MATDPTGKPVCLCPKRPDLPAVYKPKEIFMSRKVAKAVAKKSTGKPRPYLCEFCGLWHLTTYRMDV